MAGANPKDTLASTAAKVAAMGQDESDIEDRRNDHNGVPQFFDVNNLPAKPSYKQARQERKN